MKKVFNFIVLFYYVFPQEFKDVDYYISRLRDKRVYKDERTSKSRKLLWNKKLDPSDGKSTITGRYCWAGNEAKGNPDDDYVRMLNPKIRNDSNYANHKQKFGGGADFVVNIPNVIDSSRWMSQLWAFIKNMPANQFIFPGTHDSLTGYPTVKSLLNISNAKSKTQENLTFSQQLDIGVRFFDIRFVDKPWWYSGKENLENMLGVHSGVVFQVTVKDFVEELKKYLEDGKKDILFITLSLSESSNILGSSKVSPDQRWDEFIEYLISQNLGDKLIKNNVGVSPSSTLAEMADHGRIILQSNNTDYKGKYSEYFWAPSEGPGDPKKDWSKEDNAKEWYKELMKLGYISFPLSSKNVFNYLPMTQTGYDGDATWKMNGLLGDWIVFANPDVPADQRPQDIVLPYKPYKDGEEVRDMKNYNMKNYNLINVDYIDRSPFVLNCITQNLIASKKFN